MAQVAGVGRLPDFLIIGAQKAGTSSLWAYLRQCDRVFMPEPKEPQFFSEKWNRGIDWYTSLFADADRGELCGEGSTHYSTRQAWPDVPRRIHETCPDVRLVYLLRDPVERIRSLYQQRLHSRVEHRSLEKLLENEPEYLDGCAYADQMAAYFKYFDRDQILVLPSDRLLTHRVEVVNRVFRFLDLPEVAEQLHLDFEANSASTRFSFPSWFVAARRAGKAVGAHRLLPLSVKRRVREHLSIEQPPKVRTVSPELEQGIYHYLRVDVERLAGFVDPAEFPWMNKYLQLR